MTNKIILLIILYCTNGYSQFSYTQHYDDHTMIINSQPLPAWAQYVNQWGYPIDDIYNPHVQSFSNVNIGLGEFVCDTIFKIF
jgi:hypothetical protein